MEAKVQQSRLPIKKPTLRNRKLCADIKAKTNSFLKKHLSDGENVESSNSDSNELKVRLYRSIVDLRKQADLKPTSSITKAMITSSPKSSTSSTDQKMAKNVTSKDKTVSKRCMKITTYACTQNTFDTATSIITERIISKQLELEREKKCTRRLLQHQGKMPDKIDDVVVERILEKQDELRNKKLLSITSSNATDSVNAKSVKFLEQEDSAIKGIKGKEEMQRTANRRPEPPKLLKNATINARDIVNANKKIPRAKASTLKIPMKQQDAEKAKGHSLSRSSKLYKSLPNLASGTTKRTVSGLNSSKIPKTITLPKFILSSRPAGRVTVAHIGTQDNIRNEQCSACNQTIAELDDFFAQTNIMSETNDLSVQADQQIDIYTEGTNTSPIANYSRYTSTFKQPDVFQQTQMMEYMTGNDLYCLEWVRDYLFDINFDPRQIIVGDKLKEVSEIGTKTSLI